MLFITADYPVTTIKISPKWAVARLEKKLLPHFLKKKLSFIFCDFSKDKKVCEDEIADETAVKESLKNIEMTRKRTNSSVIFCF